MKLQIPEMNPKVFYQVGKYAFFINGLIGLIRILDLWNQLKSYEVFSSLASAVFYLILSWFFSSLQSKEDIREVPDGDIIKMNKALDSVRFDAIEKEELKTIEEKGGKKNAKKTRS